MGYSPWGHKESDTTEQLSEHSVLPGLPRWLSGRIHLPMQETQEMQVQSLGQKDPLEKGMATRSGILA